MTFVLDASLTMAWCFRDEETPYTQSVLEQLRATDALVPAVWPLEVANVILIGERGQRLTTAETTRFLDMLASLAISVEPGVVMTTWGQVLTLGRAHGLSAYDASYLELAMREDLPLATLDRALQAAARRVGVQLLE